MARVQVDFSRMAETVVPAFYPLFADRRRYLILNGGTGSGKSRSTAQKIVWRAVSEPGHRFIVIRKIAKTLQESCFAEIKTVIRNWGLNPIFDIPKRYDTGIRCLNGSEAIFVGMDDPEKLKSISEPTGVWIEEATEFMPADLEEIGRRVRHSTGYYTQIILTFNPISERHWLKARFFDSDQRGLTTTHKSTYRDNPYLSPEYLLELKDLEQRNPESWQVYGLGQWGRKLSGLVYGYDIEIPASKYPKAFDETIYGLDFGFNNPSALIKIGLKDQAGYIRELLYATGLTTDDLITRMEGFDISKRDPIYADSSEPDRIEQIRRAGYNIHPADKAPGSVGAGITCVREQRLYSCPENANFDAEWNSYKWRVDRVGQVLDEPDKANDHAMDAVRYAIYTHIGRGRPAPNIFIGK
jgi:phage terminase large subunit